MDRFNNCMYKDVCDFGTSCSNGCVRYSITKYMLKHSGIPKSKWGLNVLVPESCDVQAYEQLSDIRDNIVDFVGSGKNLCLHSLNCGNGKTTWAIKLMLQYFNDTWEYTGYNARGVFINVPLFLYECKEAISKVNPEFEELKTLLKKVDLVIWDDIAFSKMSSYDYSLLMALIDKRILEEKSNIFTSNVNPDKLVDYVGDRLASRINSSIKIEFKGRDRR